MIRARLSELALADLGEDIWTELYPRAEAGLIKGVDLIVAAAKRNVSKRRGTARSSAPAGESPELDEGDLYESIQRFPARRTRHAVKVPYGSDAPGARTHEYGGRVPTADGPKEYPARPYFRPAEAETEAEVEGILDAL